MATQRAYEEFYNLECFELFNDTLKELDPLRVLYLP